MLHRVKPSLLLALFLAAGTSLPSIDAVLYHQQQDGTGKSETHVEPAGGCPNHGGHCGLGRTAPGSAAAIGASGEVRIEPAPAPALRRLPRQVLLNSDHFSLPQQRAPPAFQA